MEAKLVVISKQKAGMEIPISAAEFAIGGGDDCQFRVHSKQVSQRHCLILLDDDSAAVEDCGSATGTLVNGKSVQGRLELNSGDRLTIGPLEMEVQLDADSDGNGDDPLLVSNANANINEVSILHWLEDGEDAPIDEERFWRKAARKAREAAMGQESDEDQDDAESGQGPDGYGGPGLDGSYGSMEMLREKTDVKPKPKVKISIEERIWLIVRPVIGPIVAPLLKLDRFERMLLGMILVLLLIGMMVLFPVTFVWFKTIVNVRRWSHWVWSGILLVILRYLFWLRSRYE